MKYILLACLFVSSAALAGPFDDARYCGFPVKRDADGRIHRDRGVIKAFKRLYPCPVTHSSTGACKGWAINHSIPLACGGCDSVSNLDWMPDAIKSCADAKCRDRWEMQVYCTKERP